MVITYSCYLFYEISEIMEEIHVRRHFMNRQEKRGIVEILIGSVLWGTIGLFVLWMNGLGASSALISFLRMAFAFIILLFMTLLLGGVRALFISRRALFFSALLGLICQGLYNVFYNRAIVEIGMTMSAVFLNTAPVCTLTAAHFLLKESLTIRKWNALLLCIAGCVLTVTDGHLSLSGFSPYGIVCGILSGMTYGMTSIFGRMAGEKTNVWAMSTYSYFFASLFLLACDPDVLSEAGNISIAFAGFLYALIPTALAYVIYYKGVQKIRENSKVPVIASAETITASLLGALLFQETLQPLQYMGMGLIFLSILLMNGKLFHVKQCSRTAG